jgi:hypothetical protein
MRSIEHASIRIITCEVSKLGRDRSSEWVAIDTQIFQAREAAILRRYAPIKVVTSQAQVLEGGNPPQVSRQWPWQIVVEAIQNLQMVYIIMNSTWGFILAMAWEPEYIKHPVPQKWMDLKMMHESRFR